MKLVRTRRIGSHARKRVQHVAKEGLIDHAARVLAAPASPELRAHFQNKDTGEGGLVLTGSHTMTRWSQDR